MYNFTLWVTFHTKNFILTKDSRTKVLKGPRLLKIKVLFIIQSVKVLLQQQL